MSAVERIYQAPAVADGLPIAVPGSDDLVLISRKRFTYWARNDEYFRLDGQSLSLVDESSVTRSETGLIRPDESFHLGVDPNTGKHFIMAHGKNRDEHLNILYSYVFPFGALSYDGRLLGDFLFTSESPWTITGVDKLDGGEVMVGLVGQFPKGKMTQTFWLLPNRNWVLSKAVAESMNEVNGASSLSQTIYAVSYQDRQGDFPLLKRVTLEGASGPGPDELRVTYRRVIDISEIVPGPADLRVFDIGLLVHDLGRIGERKETSSLTRWILIVNGLALIIISAILARRSSARTRPAGTQTEQRGEVGE